MNSIIERNISVRSRLNELCMRVSDFRQKLVGSLPAVNAATEKRPEANSDIFLDRTHSLISDLEERLAELEANINLLETFFFPQQPASSGMSGVASGARY